MLGFLRFCAEALGTIRPAGMPAATAPNPRAFRKSRRVQFDVTMKSFSFRSQIGRLRPLVRIRSRLSVSRCATCGYSSITVDHVRRFRRVLFHIEKEIRFLEGLSPGAFAPAGAVAEDHLPFSLAQGEHAGTGVVNHRCPRDGPFPAFEQRDDAEAVLGGVGRQGESRHLRARSGQIGQHVAPGRTTPGQRTKYGTWCPASQMSALVPRQM